MIDTINKRILILGGSHRDIPLIKASQELGYFVITLGDRDSYLGHNYSDKAIKVDFNNLEKIRTIIAEEGIEYILPGCGEESYLNTVKLANELHIGNFDTVEVASLVHNKWKFKEFCLAHNISTPQGIFYNSDKDIDNLNYPIVVKPTNLSGGRGVEIVNNKKQLQESLKTTKKISNEIFLEEFIDGELIAYSIFLKNQKIIYKFTAADKTYLNKYLITTAYPTIISDEILLKLQRDIEKMATILMLCNGMFHLQILIKDNIPYIIDVTRRIPGDFFPYLIEYCDKVDYSKAVVEGYTTGIIENNLIKSNKQDFIIRHCIMPTKNGIYQSLFIDNSLQNKILTNFELLQKNSKITDYLHTQLAIIFIRLDKMDSDVLNNINNLIYPIITTPNK